MLYIFNLISTYASSSVFCKPFLQSHHLNQINSIKTIELLQWGKLCFTPMVVDEINASDFPVMKRNPMFSSHQHFRFSNEVNLFICSNLEAHHACLRMVQ
ncbi:hypothetical protein IC582_018616 [Cucumis melo]